MLISIEGPDGVGKSTFAAALALRIGAWCTAEPTKSPIGLRARAAVLRSFTEEGEEAQQAALAEAFGLFTLDRLQHNLQMDDRLKRGSAVVVDRYALSTWAYQTASMTSDFAGSLRLAFAAARTPDLTILLLASDALLRARIAGRGGGDAADLAVERTANRYRVFASSLLPKNLVDPNAPFLRSAYAPGTYLVLSGHAFLDDLVDTSAAAIAALNPTPSPS